MRYEFVDNKIKVAVNDRLRDYNDLVTDVWDYLELAGFSFHGTVREWSGVFFRETYFVLHHFIKDRPDQDCIPQDSNLKWNDIFERDTSAGAFFSFLEDAGFQLYIPVQAMIDAMIDDGYNWHYQSPKHKFQMYCFHPSCALLVEMYVQNKVPPYGAEEEPVPFPQERFQPFLDFFVEPVEMTKRDRVRVIEGETLDILEKVDEELLDVTRARIKKIYDDHTRIGLLMSGGKDSRTVTQLMIEHAIQNPDPSKKIMIITSDTLVENILRHGGRQRVSTWRCSR
jgi:DNA sulfur modification protein DndC